MVVKSTQAERYQLLYDQLRAEILDHYGSACACCSGVDRLGIDHLDGDGAQHREQLFGNTRYGGGWRFWLWLVSNGFPAGYQVLCRACNRSKGNGLCCMIDHHVPEGMKQCRRRTHEGPNPLPLDAFGKDRSRSDGLNRTCLACCYVIRGMGSVERARRIITVRVSSSNPPGTGNARPPARPKPDTGAGRSW